MAQDAVETECHVDRDIRLRQPAGEICNFERKIDARLPGEIMSHASRDMNLRPGNIEAPRRDVGESESARVRDEASQPCTGTATSIQNGESDLTDPELRHPTDTNSLSRGGCPL